MASPQPTDDHLRIAHSIEEQKMVSFFSEQAGRILELILRLSWGCGHHAAYIPHQKDFEIVGVLEGHVKAHLDILIRDKVIFRDGPYYQFNKNFDDWRVSRSKGYTPERLTELVSINIQHEDVDIREKVTKLVSSNLRKTELSGYGIRKSPEPELASSKESLKKVLSSQQTKINQTTETFFRPEEDLKEKLPELTELVSIFEKCFGSLSAGGQGTLLELYHRRPDWILAAVRQAVSDAETKTIEFPVKYITGIIRNWEKEGPPSCLLNSVPERDAAADHSVEAIRATDIAPETSEESSTIWTTVLVQLQTQISKANYNAWLKDTHGVGYKENVFLVDAPNTSVVQYLDKILRSLVEKTLIGVSQKPFKVAFIVKELETK